MLRWCWNFDESFWKLFQLWWFLFSKIVDCSILLFFAIFPLFYLKHILIFIGDYYPLPIYNIIPLLFYHTSPNNSLLLHLLHTIFFPQLFIPHSSILIISFNFNIFLLPTLIPIHLLFPRLSSIINYRQLFIYWPIIIS